MSETRLMHAEHDASDLAAVNHLVNGSISAQKTIENQ